MIGWLVAAQIAIVAHGPDVGAVCAPMEITVAARVAGTVAPRLTFPTTGAFQLLRHSSTSGLEPAPDGHPFAFTEATFVVATRSTGRVSLPGIVATVGTQHAVAAPVAITVRPNPDGTDDPQVLVRASLDVRGTRVEAETLYVGQQVDYVVDVQLNEAARQRLRRNPTFFPPDMPAVLAYDVAPPAPVARSGPRCFEDLTYRRALFPLFPGPIVIPPASLTYALPLSTSFFSREETHELHTDSVRVMAVEPPVANRPSDFAGAIGEMRASSRLASTSGRMGDPVVYTLRLEGSGNIKLFPRPAFSVPWASVATGEERVDVDTTQARVSGAKEFDWLLTPREAGHHEIAAIRYPYFDPERAAYDVAVSNVIGLDVASASLVVADTAVTPTLGIRTTLREERAAPLSERPLYWVLLALAPLPATLRRTRRRRRSAPPGVPAAKRLRDLAASSAPAIARDVRRLYLDALRERIPVLVPATSRSPLARQLRRAGVTDATAEQAESLLEQLDTAAFSGGGTIGAAPTADAVRIVRDVDAQAVRPVSARRDATAIVLLVALALAGTTAFALQAGVERTFADGVRAYRAGNFKLAERQFARTAARAPRAPDAWANLGTAAWSAGDTAHAAAGWQRALRLDPLDDESRDRLSAVHGPATIAERAYVPPVPVDAVATAALAIWIVAWLALALPPARRPQSVRPLAGGALVVSLVLLGAALELRDRLAPDGLAVLRAPVSLLDEPGPSSQALTTASTGEVGMLGAREGPWVRITLDDSRAGWIPTSAVLLLDDAASN